ncbi:MAG: hypothetical protein QXU01_02335 [Candidatus Hadarchaeales archaeon]
MNMFVRSPYKEKRISEISSTDGRVRVLGTVVETGEVDLVIADETGQISCFVKDPILLQDIRPGSVIRVFGFPVGMGETKLQIDIIQKMDGLNVQLYREVRQEISRFEEGLEW